MRYAAVATSHTNPYLSGVARFNLLLAERLGVPCLDLPMALADTTGRLLVSVKLGDHDEDGMAEVEVLASRLSARDGGFDLFLHTYDGLTAEQRLIEGAGTVFAGNAEIAHALAGLGADVETLWCPELLDLTETVGEGAVELFSFGMAHKVQIQYYDRLRELLDAAGVDFTLRVSTAFHEKASFGEIDAIEAGFREIYGGRVHLLGFLSDAAVNYFLSRSDLFVAFFRKGVRANNTSVYAAMASGCAVLTNLDEFSPEWMRHGVNVLDISRLESDGLEPSALQEIGSRARRDVAANASWEKLAERLR